MSPIVIITGPPGTGKTTLAAYLARAKPRGLHIPADLFFTFPAHPISPYRASAHEQIIALARTAATFASRGYDVFLDGMFGPWFLPVIAAELRMTRATVQYVVLRARLDVALNRIRSRCGDTRDHVVRKMHAEFADLGRYASHVIETTDRSLRDLAAEFARRQAEGAFTLDLRSFSSSPRRPQV